MNGLDDQEPETAAWEFFRWQRVSVFVQYSSWYNFVWKTIITLAWGPPIISKNFMCSNFTYMCEGGMFYFSNFVHLITLGQTCSIELIANINVISRNFNTLSRTKVWTNEFQSKSVDSNKCLKSSLWKVNNVMYHLFKESVVCAKTKACYVWRSLN